MFSCFYVIGCNSFLFYFLRYKRAWNIIQFCYGSKAHRMYFILFQGINRTFSLNVLLVQNDNGVYMREGRPSLTLSGLVPGESTR